MRIGQVVGRLCLQPIYETLVGGRFPDRRGAGPLFAGGRAAKDERVSRLLRPPGREQGDLIAFSESREASMPFYPEKRVPLDAYNAAILDQVVVEKKI